MAYPLLTGTTRTATAVQVSTPVEVTLTATRTWTAIPTFQRTGTVYLWQLPLPPTSGQVWPRS